jgi:hypothetical protein
MSVAALKSLTVSAPDLWLVAQNDVQQ